jgi:hypothetical protein
MIQSAI